MIDLPPPGASVLDRPIAVELRGRDDAARRVLVVGQIHGDEPGGAAVVRAPLRRDAPPGVAVYAVRSLNPDGGRAGRRQNAHGVDLNRNFPYRWRGGPRGRYWPGPRAGSEPETRDAMALTQTAGRPGAAVVRRRGPRAARAVAAARPRAARAAAVPARPRVVWTPIPYGAGRRAQMRRYARRHAGIDTAALRAPKVIVEHFTASDTFAGAFATFASNAPNLGEKPGVCAHFVVDRDGTIHQLVPLRLQCRHAVGLNQTAIGIEHVGRGDAEVMGDRRQLAASLRLTRWLRGRYRIAVRNVIGHAESLSSPYHHELVPSWRKLTHEDFQPATMRRYRRMLR